MPLLRTKSFVPLPPPERADESGEVFYCEQTGEVFSNFDEFAQRIIQCNSLVWSCSFTGRNDMTYIEALESETEAQKKLAQLPKQLQIPLLYLTSVAQKTSFNSLVDDVYSFVKERYFMGEEVEFLKAGVWFHGSIHAVYEPPADCTTSSSGKTRDKFFPPAAMLEYDIRKKDSEDTIRRVKAGNVRRKCPAFNKDLVRIFLRQSAATDVNGVWVIKGAILHEYSIHRLQFESIFVGKPPSFLPTNIKKSSKPPGPNSKGSSKPSALPGSSPARQKSGSSGMAKSPKSNPSPPKSFPKARSSPKQGKPNIKKSHQEKIDKYLRPASEGMSKKKPGSGSPLKKSPKKTGSEGALSSVAKKVKEKFMDSGRKQKLPFSSIKISEEQKIDAIVEKRKKHEALMQERAKKKEEKLQLEKFIREWKRQRDDLECEDLKALPSPTPILFRIPNEHFGEFVMILEFLRSFPDILKVQKFFPGGLSFEILERALVDVEIAGPLVDIITMFLKASFALQEKEDYQIDRVEDSTVEVDIEGTTSDALHLAVAAAGMCKLNYGVDLSAMTINPMNLSEVLRLYILSSGGRAAENSGKWRYQQRGCYRATDDPCLQLRFEHPHILQHLAHASVCELALADKLTIISCLINQILTYTTVRNEVDERAEELRVIKSEVRSLQLAEVKREKEAQAKRIKEKKEAKMKLLKGDGQPVEPQPKEVPELSEAQKLKQEKEFQRRKAEVQKKAGKILALSMGHQLLPLGCDRAHRRYWLFQSVPGLFVEHDPRSAGPCLSKPTPCNPLARGDTLAYVRQLFEEEYNAGSDKENDGSDADLSRPVASQTKKMLSQKNESVETDSNPPWSGGKMLSVDDDKLSQLWGCTASNDCKVHCGEKIHWSFFSREEDVATLIECLNPRGIRESELRNALITDIDKINASIRECPLHKLNPEKFNVTPENLLRKSSRLCQSYNPGNANLKFPPGTSVAYMLEKSLRDYILEMEKKIFQGSLGSLKVDDPEAWREALAEGCYEQLCDDLKWGPASEAADSSSEEESEKSESNNETQTYGKRKRRAAIPLEKRKSAGTSAEDSYSASSPPPETVRKLASALLQLEQSVDPQYFKKPLVPELKKEDKPKISQLHRWEVSLMASTSLSQLYLHAMSLDMSIQWSKSALNIPCCVCRRRGHANKILLCTGCCKPHHTFCVRPKLTSIPEGGWQCFKCIKGAAKKSSASASALKRRRCRSQSPVGREDAEEISPRKSRRLAAAIVCNVCGLGEDLISCSSCLVRYHAVCLIPRPRKSSLGSWLCTTCKRQGRAAVGYSSADAATQLDTPSIRQRRGCTTATIAKIARFAKRLRSHSWDDDEAGSEPGPSRRSTRGRLEAFDSVLMQKILRELMVHKDAWPFLHPVRKSQVPDYSVIIKRPMDFSTISKKMNSLAYTSNSEVTADILLIFENCKMYNQMFSAEYRSGSRLLRFFKQRCKELGLELHPDV